MSAASSSSVTANDAIDPEHRPSRPAGPVGPTEAAGEPGEGVLLALERQRARDQQHGDEHQRDRRGDRDRERVELARSAPATTCLSTSIGEATAPSSGSAKPRFCAGEVGEPDHLVERRAGVARGRQLGADLTQDLARVLRARGCRGRRAAAGSNVPALEQQVEVAATAWSEIRWERIRFASVTSAWIRSSTRLRLDRVVLVDEHLDRRLLRVEAGQRLELVEQVRRQDQRGEHVAVLDLLLGLLARWRRRRTRPASRARRGRCRGRSPRCRPSWNCWCGAGISLRKATRGFGVVGREREADQHAEHDRVDDQQRRRSAASGAGSAGP